MANTFICLKGYCEGVYLVILENLGESSEVEVQLERKHCNIRILKFCIKDYKRNSLVNVFFYK